MTEEAINIAICEACGRKYHKPTDEEVARGSYYQYEPNYYRSLDAMHSAERVLTSPETYIRELYKVCEPGPVTFSTAAQRAEAFLKTIGKWKE